MNNAKVF